MRLTVLPVMAAALALSGCVMVAPAPVAPPVVQPLPPVVVAPPAPSASDAARASARQVVNVEMAKKLRGRNVAPFTQCVLDNATMAEISDLSTLGGSPAATGAVAAIVSRPATAQCIKRANVA